MPDIEPDLHTAPIVPKCLKILPKVAMPSALIGQPPSDQKDYWIIKGMMRILQIPDSAVDPYCGFPLTLKPPPDYEFETRGPRILVGLSFAVVLVVLITGTRLSIRMFRRDLRWGLDDWIIIPATFISLAWFGCCMGLVTHGGLGKHLWDTTYKEVYWFFRLGAIHQTLFWISVGLVKISIALFNRRLTGPTSKRWMIAHNIFLVLLVCWVSIALFLNLFECKPALVQYDLIKWGQVHGKTTCLDQNSLGIGLSVTHIVFDFVLLSVPIIVLISVKMNTAKKIRLGLLFSVGSISCIGSVMRQFLAVSTKLDSSWSMVTQVSWTVVDIFFAITAASLPVLNSLLPQNFLSSSHSDFVYVCKLSSSIKTKDVKFESPGHGPNRSELIYRSSDDSPGDISQDKSKQDAPSRRDPAALVQHPRPKHRDRLCTRSIHEVQE